MASPIEGQPKGLNSKYIETRLKYAVETFRELVKNPEEFKSILDRFGYDSNQIPFVAQMANLVNTGALTEVTVAGRRFDPKPLVEEEKPQADTKRLAEGTYTEVDSLGVGFARLKVHPPKDSRVIDSGYVHWDLVSRAGGAALRRMAEKNGDFLSLVLVDPSLLEARNFRQFIMAAHSDEPNLQPQSWYSGLSVRFAGKTAFQRVQGPGIVDATFWSKDRHWNETWVVGARSKPTGEPDVLVGKQVS